MKELRLTFPLHRSDLLNANNLPNNHFIKGKIASNLRLIAYEEGLKHLSEEQRLLVENRKLSLDSENTNKAIKGRIVKQLKKQHKGISVKDLKILTDEEVAKLDLDNIEASSGMVIDPLFNFFRITVIIESPTRRRIDPPNFSPTAKHLIDGLTDCGFWIDDSWQYLDEVSFRYGGMSGEKDIFNIHLDIQEIQK